MEFGSELHTEYYSADQIKKNMMGKAYSTYGGEEKYILDYGRES